MLYARCAHCGYAAPLNCSGQFMPHQTMFVSPTPMGPGCQVCGPLPPVFTCPCGFTQYLFLPGITPLPQQGSSYVYAPVVQARPDASGHTLRDLFGEIIGNVATEIGKGAADAIFGQFQ